MTDLIRRQETVEELHTCQKFLFDSRDHDLKISLEDAEYAIQQLPSADPEREGKWIEDGYYGLPCVCSYCGTEGKREWKYCPNCGARMNDETREG